MNDIHFLAALLSTSFVILFVCSIILIRSRTDVISSIATTGFTVFTGAMALGAIASC